MKMRLGIVGCGAVSDQYFGHLQRFPFLEVVSCADVDVERARRQAARFNVPCIESVDDLLSADRFDLVVNLTPPKVHGSIALSAVRFGKHVWNEKPLATSLEEGRLLVEAARINKVEVGCAPDTILGSSQQAIRLAVDEGRIGRPVAATAIMLCPGHESWHLNPDFYYQPGGGPMLDMGPYYLAAMINILGPIKRVAGQVSLVKSERVITHRDSLGNPGPRFGDRIQVETPDHIAGLIEFESACSGTIITSFAADSEYEEFPLVIYGTEGTIRVTNPNYFDGHVQIRSCHGREWIDVPVVHCQGYGRGVGVAELMKAVLAEEPPRCSGDLGLAVLDVVHGFYESSRSGHFYATRLANHRPRALDPTNPSLYSEI